MNWLISIFQQKTLPLHVQIWKSLQKVYWKEDFEFQICQFYHDFLGLKIVLIGDPLFLVSSLHLTTNFVIMNNQARLVWIGKEICKLVWKDHNQSYIYSIRDTDKIKLFIFQRETFGIGYTIGWALWNRNSFEFKFDDTRLILWK